MKTVMAGSAGIALLNHLNSDILASSTKSDYSFMGGITKFAILNDVAILAVAGKQISIANAARISADINHPIAANLSRMGTIVAAEENQVRDQLIKLKTEIYTLNSQLEKNLNSQKDLKSDLMKQRLHLEKKISLLLGWYMATGIRNNLDKLYANKMKSSEGLPSDLSIYHDMYVLKQVSGTDQSAQLEDLASLFRGIQPRMICRTHTLTPDYDDGKNWTVRITNWRNDSMQLMEKYAQAYAEADKTKVADYITGMNFYNPDDELIRLARWVQAGNYIKKIDNLVKVTNNLSVYARALAQGLVALKKADQILNSV